VLSPWMPAPMMAYLVEDGAVMRDRFPSNWSQSGPYCWT